MVSGAPAYSSLTLSPLSLQRVQGVNYSFNFNAQQLREIGSYEYIKHRELNNSRIPIVSQPEVSLSFSYFLYDAFNEKQIGLTIGDGVSASRGIFTDSPLYSPPDYSQGSMENPGKGDINFFVLAEDSSWRNDIVGRSQSEPFDGLDLMGFGNCYLNSYNISASLGNFVQCSAEYSCSNMSFDIYDSSSKPLSPAVSPQGKRSTSEVSLPEEQLKEQVEHPNEEESILVLRPGDLEVYFNNNKKNSEGGFNLVDLNSPGMAVQSIEISIPIDRKTINGFGSSYIKDRKIQFPIFCTLDISVLARSFEGDGSDIKQIFKDDVDFAVNLKMFIRDSLTNKFPKMDIKIDSAKLNSESHSMSIDGYSQVDASFLFEVTPFGGMSIDLLPEQ